jgi:hypothetical protein
MPRKAVADRRAIRGRLGHVSDGVRAETRATDRAVTVRSVSVGHDEARVTDVEFLRGKLRARRWRLPWSRCGTVRSTLQEDRQRVAASAPSGRGPSKRDANDLVSGSRVDVRRRCRQTSSCDVLSRGAQLQPVVGGQHARMTGSVGKREARSETGVRAARAREHRRMGLLGRGTAGRAGRRGRRGCRGDGRPRSDWARPRRANTRPALRERDRAPRADSGG